ncbi:MAG: ATP-binding protein [Candidatus Eisenbacteria bacterium]
MLFATLAVAATALLSWVSYRGVRSALEAEFVRRLENLAGTIASQVSPEDIADVQNFGEEGQGYAALQVLLEEMRATAQLDNAAVLDTARRVIYDCHGDAGASAAVDPIGASGPAGADAAVDPIGAPGPAGAHAAVDSIAAPGLSIALAGGATVSSVYSRGGVRLRAGFAPITGGGNRVAGVVMVEAPPDDDRVLAGLRRDFLLRTLLAALAMSVLAALMLRVVWSSQRLERRLSRAENLAAMGRLTATLAHEIKNPLAIIRGSAERLGKLEPEARRMADYVIEESDRLSRTVARYLQFARGEAEGIGDGDAISALAGTLALLEGEFTARRVMLDRDADLHAARVPLDNESLKQVYLNLILNALDAMTDGGTLAVTAAERGGNIEVRIADTGPGMTPQVVKKLGSPFFTTRAQGTGLGLFLARRLLESAGGSLEIESEIGRGTACTVRLPITPGETGTA